MNGNRIQIVRSWNIITADDTGTGTLYPLTLDPPDGDNRNTIAKWYAVQKNWRLQGELTNITGEVFSFDTTVASRALNQAEFSERTLIHGIYGVYFDDYFPADAGSYHVRVFGGIGASDENTGEPAAYVAGTELGPWISIFVYLYTAGLPTPGTSAFESHTNNVDIGAPEADITVTINGEPSPVQFYGGGPGPPEDYTLTGTLTITAPAADGYFEFRDTDSLNPVFNVDTGVQLIVPAPLT